MQSYRLLAAVPLSEKDKPLIKEMEQTAFSAELTRAAERDGQLAQLQGLQDYWRNELIPCADACTKPRNGVSGCQPVCCRA